MYACMYACIYVCMYVHIHKITWSILTIPLFILVNSKPTKTKLLDHVVCHVSPKWYVLGLKLLKEDQESHLDIIKSDHAIDNKKCCMEMFWHWLDTNTSATWEQLIDALQSTAVELPIVAANIKKMLKGSYIIILLL